MWKLNYTTKKPELKNPILIEGLPGIGNVGKLALDFIIDETKAKKIAEFHSFGFPHSVFVNEENLVELPAIEVFVKQRKRKPDLLLLAGDVQPLDEQSCYQFSDAVLEMAKELGCNEIITLGGVAMKQAPKKPQVYLTGNNKEIVRKYLKSTTLNQNIYGTVGPIVGVSGVLVGLAKRKNIDAVSLLAETYGHPMYLGVAGAKEILKVLNKKLNLNLRMKQLEKELSELEQEMAENPAINQVKSLAKLRKHKDTSYIG
ncbi:MAG: PAC2 family protein [Candidatus Woesearchaeota archaeon]